MPQTPSPSKSLLHRSLTWIYWYSYNLACQSSCQASSLNPIDKAYTILSEKKATELSKWPFKNFYHYLSSKKKKNYFCFSETCYQNSKLCSFKVGGEKPHTKGNLTSWLLLLKHIKSINLCNVFFLKNCSKNWNATWQNLTVILSQI